MQWTPMDCAANYGYANLIKLLIDCDAPIDAEDRSLVCTYIQYNNMIRASATRHDHCLDRILTSHIWTNTSFVLKSL